MDFPHSLMQASTEASGAQSLWRRLNPSAMPGFDGLVSVSSQTGYIMTVKEGATDGELRAEKVLHSGRIAEPTYILSGNIAFQRRATALVEMNRIAVNVKGERSFMKYSIRAFMVMIFVTLCIAAVQAQNITPAQQSAVGTWVSAEGGKYQLYLQDGKLFGKMVQPPPKYNNLNGVCKKCDGELKNAPLVGFPLIVNLVPDGEGWSGGKINDPGTGMVLSVKVKATGNSLDIHAYIGNPLLGQSQTWTRGS